MRENWLWVAVYLSMEVFYENSEKRFIYTYTFQFKLKQRVKYTELVQLKF
jgi:hypothetical protein